MCLRVGLLHVLLLHIKLTCVILFMGDHLKLFAAALHMLSSVCIPA